ncbi:MAG: PDZ domain-containing protein [bacterium]
MIRQFILAAGNVTLMLAVTFVGTLAPASTGAQSFDFERLGSEVQQFSVVVDMTVQISFGAHSSEQQQKYLGTIVTTEGLVMFNGSDLLSDNAMSSYSGFSVRTEPTKIEISTLGGTTFRGEYVGSDQYTRLGFVKIADSSGQLFQPVSFVADIDLQVGDWLAIHMLLPDFISPSLMADVGMVSTLVQKPEVMPLTIGFNSLQLASVMYDEKHRPVGVLGILTDPSQSPDEGGDGMSQFPMPLLGVITADRIARLVAKPPVQGEIDRGWLGIRLQALTEDMAEYWGLEIDGGIIVNEVMKNSPSEAAGLQVGDIIYELNGLAIDVSREESLPIFQRSIADLGPHAAVEMAVLRPGAFGLDTIRTVATLAEAPIAAGDSPEYKCESLEFTIRNLVLDDYMFFNQDPDTFQGVFVSALEPGGLAEIGGLQYGDVIQRIEAAEVIDVAEAEQMLDSLALDKPREIVFFVWRGSRTLFVNVKTDW